MKKGLENACGVSKSLFIERCYNCCFASTSEVGVWNTGMSA